MKIGRLVGGVDHQVGRVARLLLVGVYIAILGVVSGVGMPEPVKAHYAHGISIFGIWTGVHLNVSAVPGAGGSVMVSPSTAVNDDEQPIWGVGATIVAIPLPGWEFAGWQLPVNQLYMNPTDWVAAATPDTCVIQLNSTLNQEVAAFNNGCFDILANFRPSTVQLEIQPGVGFTWLTSYGQMNPPLGSVVPLQVTVAPAYTALYEFGGWVTNFAGAAIDDVTSMDTHIDIDWVWFPDLLGYWVRPQLQVKEGHSHASFQTTGAEPNGEIEVGGGEAAELVEMELGVGELVTVLWSPSENQTTVQFVKWVLVNMSCSDVGAAWTQMWPMSTDNSSATAITTVEAELYYTVEIVKVGTGTTSPPVGSYVYEHGSQLLLRATAGGGYVFSHWVGVNGLAWEASATVTHGVTDNATLTAYFLPSGGGGGDGGDSDTGAMAMGLWGQITDSLDAVGMANTMGRMMAVLAGMVIAALAAGKNKPMRIIGPLGVLGIGIIGLWVPLWIVILLAIGAGVGLLGFFGKRTAA